jgi:hypothetical protein
MNPATLTKNLFDHKIEWGHTEECRICLFTSDIAEMNDGICEYCLLQDQLRASANPADWFGVLEEIKAKGKRNKYDVVIGISGGEDSSVLLYLAVKVWGLRPLVIHFNNRTNRPEADNNIKVLVDNLNVNFIEFFLDMKEYNDLSDSLLKAGVPDCDIANDVCMSKMMYTTARDNGIKYILNGHSFREEGSSPKAWSVIDYTYLNSVYKKWTGKNLVNYPLLTIWDQVMMALKGIKQVRPFHYSTHDRPRILKSLESIGYQDYGGKHNENIYTAFIGNYVLPRKFKIDKRITYLSARIREGLITKESAKEILNIKPEFNLDDLGERRMHLLNLMNTFPIRPRSDYKMTDFKAWKPLLWILMKLGAFPATAYSKYVK